uniref:PAZ domain-containing protein n=1 Tax=Globodera rostochiensis TaxID=31243 RepID=A0A914HPL7_GLORO
MDSISNVAWLLNPTSGGERDRNMADALGTDNNAHAPPRQGRPLSQHSTMDYDEKEDDMAVIDKTPYDEGEQMATHGRLLLFVDDSDGEENDDIEEKEDVEDIELGSGDQNAEKLVDGEENGGNSASADAKATSAPATGDTATVEEIMEPTEEIIFPLLDYLCTFNDCSLKELQVLFHSVQARQRMVTHLQHNCLLRTGHLKPPERNVGLHCHDLSAQNANRTFACGGYLELTVRQYYFAKHGLKLKHPYLPCMIEFGGGAHASYYPLELVHVIVEHPKQQGPHAVAFLKLLNRNNNNNNNNVSSSNAGVADERVTDARLSGGRPAAEGLPSSTPLPAPQAPSHRCCCCCGCGCTTVETRPRR